MVKFGIVNNGFFEKGFIVSLEEGHKRTFGESTNKGSFCCMARAEHKVRPVKGSWR